MTRRVKFCRLDTSLGDVIGILQLNWWGSLPVLDRARNVVGIITDRDICLALGAGNITSMATV